MSDHFLTPVTLYKDFYQMPDFFFFTKILHIFYISTDISHMIIIL